MSINPNWDVEKYRTDYESEEHWLLKCAFIEAHKDRFSEEQLICLAQVFFNVEFLGCRYPQETMELVAELSKDVAKDFRDSRKNNLKRTFVTASNAIEAKYKEKLSNKNDTPTTSFQSKQKISFVAADEEDYKGNKRCLDLNEHCDPSKCEHKSTIAHGSNQLKYDNFTDDQLKHAFKGFIIYETDESPSNIIACSASKNGHMPFCIEKNQETSQFNVYINNYLLGKNETKLEACQDALLRLRTHFYTIKVKNKLFFSKTNKKSKNESVLATTSDSDKIDSNNLGFKLLKSLGWSGGGLGSKKTGIVDPIKGNIKIGRGGFGLESAGGLGKRNISKIKIKKLKLQSFGKDDDRSLAIGRYKNIDELFNNIMNKEDPALKQKYKIIKPLNDNRNKKRCIDLNEHHNPNDCNYKSTIAHKSYQFKYDNFTDDQFKHAFRRFIIYEPDESPSNIIACSALKNGHMQFCIEKNQETSQFDVYINNYLLAKNKTRLEACQDAVLRLKKHFYTIKVKENLFSNTLKISKNDSKPTNTSDSDKIDSNNLGFNSLGWSEGELGRKKRGIVDPIEGDIKIGRGGLGLVSATGLDERRINNLLSEYRLGNDLSDMIFSSEFSKEERAQVHMIAKEMKLKSKSFGKDDDRHLVISRYNNIYELFNNIINNADPALLRKYEIIKPLN